MTIDVSAVGHRTAAWTREWSSADSLLYALAVGAGPENLALTTENSEGITQQAMPTMAALLAGGASAVAPRIGPAWSPSRLVYAGQRVDWHRELPPAGRVELQAEIEAITDKWSGALVEVAVRATGPDSAEPVFTSRSAAFLRGLGGFDPDRAATRLVDPVASGSPETVVRHRLPENQALLYRLTGDRTPLHSDPTFAAKAGFDRPILHGLCTYGVTARLLLQHALDGDPGRMTGFGARFRTPVFPGDELELRYRETAPGRIGFRVLRAGSDRPALDDGVLTHRTETR